MCRSWRSFSYDDFERDLLQSDLVRCPPDNVSEPVLYSLTETETETEIYIISLSETEMETEMFCKTEMKYKRKSESIKRNSN